VSKAIGCPPRCKPLIVTLDKSRPRQQGEQAVEDSYSRCPNAEQIYRFGQSLPLLIVVPGRRFGLLATQQAPRIQHYGPFPASHATQSF